MLKKLSQFKVNLFATHFFCIIIGLILSNLKQENQTKRDPLPNLVIWPVSRPGDERQEFNLRESIKVYAEKDGKICAIPLHKVLILQNKPFLALGASLSEAFEVINLMKQKYKILITKLQDSTFSKAQPCDKPGRISYGPMVH